ncbi:hypothetical protein I4U23_006646 [Adineta vaga]|nr:hypothetical protein I4U23_006646 [Adineta vaga]
MGRASTMMSGKRNDDSMSDRLNYRYTVAILVIFAIINMNRLYTDQIKCWVSDLISVPAFFTPNYDEYVRSVCFVQNTYYIKHVDKIPKSSNIKRQSEILYYQWIPFLLLMKAFLFYIPRMSWNTFGLRSGIQISDLVESSYDYKLPTTDAAHRQMCLDYVISTIDEYCDDHRRQVDARKHLNILQRKFSFGWCLSGKYLGNYLVVVYMTTKLLYIGISHWAFVSSWDSETRLFPKTTLCDFTVREFGHPKLAHEYTVPCVLPLNLFNQQMFTFLYFWYLIVILLNIGDFFLWLYIISPRNRYSFLRTRLHTKKYPLTNATSDSEKIRRFADEYLEADGFFMLTLIRENSSDFVASEIIHHLFTDKFLTRYFRDTTTTTTIYDAIDTKHDDNDSDNNKTKRRHQFCSLIC